MELIVNAPKEFLLKELKEQQTPSEKQRLKNFYKIADMVIRKYSEQQQDCPNMIGELIFALEGNYIQTARSITKLPHFNKVAQKYPELLQHLVNSLTFLQTKLSLEHGIQTNNYQLRNPDQNNKKAVEYPVSCPTK